MITEDFVSLETAKLLKEKGFDGGCRARYGSAGSFSYEKYEVEASGCEMHNAILAPTLQMAMKWLREVHNLLIVIDKSANFYAWQLEDNENGDYVGEVVGEYSSYEEACEAAIKYCLENLI